MRLNNNYLFINNILCGNKGAKCLRLVIYNNDIIVIDVFIITTFKVLVSFSFYFYIII